MRELPDPRLTRSGRARSGRGGAAADALVLLARGGHVAEVARALVADVAGAAVRLVVDARVDEAERRAGEAERVACAVGVPVVIGGRGVVAAVAHADVDELPAPRVRDRTALEAGRAIGGVVIEVAHVQVAAAEDAVLAAVHRRSA